MIILLDYFSNIHVTDLNKNYDNNTQVTPIMKTEELMAEYNLQKDTSHNIYQILPEMCVTLLVSSRKKDRVEGN